MSGNALVQKCVQGDPDKMIFLKGRFSYPVYPGQALTLVGYRSSDKNEILFEVINPEGKKVIKNGIFRHT
jgi:hypothetical protein